MQKHVVLFFLGSVVKHASLQPSTALEIGMVTKQLTNRYCQRYTANSSPVTSLEFRLLFLFLSLFLSLSKIQESCHQRNTKVKFNLAKTTTNIFSPL